MSRFARSWILPVVFTVAALPAAGCAPFLGGLMVSAPNRINLLAGTQSTMPPAARRVLGIDQQIRVKVGPPDASLNVSIIEPRVGDVPKGTIVVPDFSRTILPGVGALIPDVTLQVSVTAGGKQAAFDPDLADAVTAIQKTDAPILILHGTEDWMVPPYHSIRLHAAARDHSQLVMLPWTGHISIWFDPTHEVRTQTRQWFDRWLSGWKA